MRDFEHPTTKPLSKAEYCPESSNANLAKEDQDLLCTMNLTKAALHEVLEKDGKDGTLTLKDLYGIYGKDRVEPLEAFGAASVFT